MHDPSTTLSRRKLLGGGNQIGEVAAKQLGYYATEGIEFAIQPGGPSIDGVAIVASGRWEVGQVSSSPSNMLAVSQDLPIKVFATGLQQHPYTFFSLKKNPIRTPKDMIGKKIGIQSTGLVLLRALLAKNKIDEKSMTIIPIGADMTPLLTGQVDAIGSAAFLISDLAKKAPDKGIEPKFTVATAYYAIAVKPGNFDLLQWVNTWVFVNKNNGVLAKIYETHTGVKLVDLPPL